MFTKSFVAKWMVAVFMLSLLISCGGGTSTTTTGGNNPNPQPSDTTPPTVNSVTPVDTTTDIAVNTAISAVFSEAMKQTTITNATFTVTPPVTGTVIYSGTTATFAPYSNLSSSTTYTVTITRDAKDLAGNSLASNYVWTFKTAGSTPDSHLVGYWKFDETSDATAFDSSGNSNTGTLTNGPVWTTGKAGNALQFDGVDDYVDTGNGASLQITGAITLAGWVKLNSLSSDNAFFGRGQALGSNGNRGYFVSFTGSSTKKIYFDTYNTTTRDALFTGSNAINDNNWHYVVATWDGTSGINSKKIYLDGLLDAQKSSSITEIGAPNVNFRIGADSNQDLHTNGLIDEVKVYNRALSISEIIEEYFIYAPSPVPNPIILPPSACPLGGGVGYANIVSPTNATFSVNNKADLLSALSSAKSGEIIYVNDDAEIDLTDQANLIIPAGVTLASGRGNGSSQGALLFSNRLTYTGGTEQLWKLFKSGGSGVRVTGIRLVGNDNETRGDAYEYSTSMGIYSEHNVEVDNSELSGWSDCAVCLYYTPASVTPQIHNNFIHHNRREGLGYGVVHAYAGNSIIEGNIFDWNRHSIAGDGRVNTSYTARYNLVLGNGNSHSFDMHGGADRGDGTGVAGKTINIYGNTFSTIRGIDTTWNEYAVIIRGIPTDGAYIHDNYFSNNNQTDAILQKNAFENMNINNNIFSGTYPTPTPASYPFCSTPTP